MRERIERNMQRTTAIALACLAFAAIATNACRVQPLHDLERPALRVPDAYRAELAAGGSAPNADNPDGVPLVDRWWETFEDPELTRVVEEALAANLDLRAAWRRLDQAVAVTTIQGSQAVPQVDLQAGASRSRISDRDAIDPLTGTEGRRTDRESRYFVGGLLRWEIDIWRRIADARTAAELRARATRDDAEATALLLTGIVADTWFRIREQRALLDLLERQIEVGETLLGLTELRFSLGDGTALDVLQQRQQLAATIANVPTIRAELATAENRLAVLLGITPDALSIEPAEGLPELPPMPRVTPPVDLFTSRPDLRAAMNRLEAADHDVASAFADRLPRLALDLSYEFSSNSSGELFQRQAGSILGSLLAPIVDGGRRRAEVDRRRAVLQELFEIFGAQYLDAVREVEDALARERYQVELLAELDRQLEFATNTLNESRSRYVNGLTDYLTVIIAVQSLQELERRILNEERRLLAIRAELHQAIGGEWPSELEAAPPRELAERGKDADADADSGAAPDTEPHASRTPTPPMDPASTETEASS